MKRLVKIKAVTMVIFSITADHNDKIL